MPLKPYKKPAGRARYLLPQMNFVDPGAEAKTQRPKLPTRGLGVVGIDVEDEIKKRKKADLLRAQLTRGQSRVIDGFLLLDACGVVREGNNITHPRFNTPNIVHAPTP